MNSKKMDYTREVVEHLEIAYGNDKVEEELLKLIEEEIMIDLANGSDRTVINEAWICRNCGNVNMSAICSRCGNTK